MELTLPQVAKIFGVSESLLTRWVQQENLPVHEVNSNYRFDSVELLEWAALRQISFSPEIFQQIRGHRPRQSTLAEAIDRGTVALRVSGGDRYEVFRQAVSRLSLPAGFDAENLLSLLMAREKAGGTAVGDGIAIPHPRYPVVLPGDGPQVLVCYLEHPLDFAARDGKPVHTLFLLICPTMHEHLQLLSRLASLLRREDFRRLLAGCPDKTRLVAAVRAEEQALDEVRDEQHPG